MVFRLTTLRSLVLTLFLAVPSKGTDVSKQSRQKDNRSPVSTATQKCNNVYNTFNAGPNTKMEGILLEIKQKLDEVHHTKMEGILLEINQKLTEVHREIKSAKGNETKRENCADLFKSGERISGVYRIDPDGSGFFDVFCDQTTAGGGWTVFQKRLDGSVDFYRAWDDYKRGFGNLNGELWLGLDKINRLTKNKRNRLRVDLEDTKGKTAYAQYDVFAVSSERSKYQLSLGTYSGTAGDSLSYHRGLPFSTKDQDNDVHSSLNCAVRFKGAWWYKSCHESNLNGLYHHGQHSSGADGVNWGAWKGHNYSAKRAEMKIRPVDF